jgi:hypothetical protein
VQARSEKKLRIPLKSLQDNGIAVLAKPSEHRFPDVWADPELGAESGAVEVGCQDHGAGFGAPGVKDLKPQANGSGCPRGFPDVVDEQNIGFDESFHPCRQREVSASIAGLAVKSACGKRLHGLSGVERDPQHPPRCAGLGGSGWSSDNQSAPVGKPVLGNAPCGGMLTEQPVNVGSASFGGCPEVHRAQLAPSFQPRGPSAFRVSGSLTFLVGLPDGQDARIAMPRLKQDLGRIKRRAHDASLEVFAAGLARCRNPLNFL